MFSPRQFCNQIVVQSFGGMLSHRVGCQGHPGLLGGAGGGSVSSSAVSSRMRPAEWWTSHSARHAVRLAWVLRHDSRGSSGAAWRTSQSALGVLLDQDAMMLNPAVVSSVSRSAADQYWNHRGSP